MTTKKCLCIGCERKKVPYWYNPISDEGFCEECYESQSKSKLLDLATGN